MENAEFITKLDKALDYRTTELLAENIMNAAEESSKNLLKTTEDRILWLIRTAYMQGCLDAMDGTVDAMVQAKEPALVDSKQ